MEVPDNLEYALALIGDAPCFLRASKAEVEGTGETAIVVEYAGAEVTLYRHEIPVDSTNRKRTVYQGENDAGTVYEYVSPAEPREKRTGEGVTLRYVEVVNR